MARSLLVASFLAAVACSGGGPSGETEQTTSTSDGTESGGSCQPGGGTADCRTGLLGCPCNADCSCDVRLGCQDGISVQIDQGDVQCQGLAYCECQGDRCAAGLECVEDRCLPNGVGGGPWLSECFASTQYTTCNDACAGFGATCEAMGCQPETFVSYRSWDECGEYQAVFSGIDACSAQLDFGMGSYGRCCCAF